MLRLIPLLILPLGLYNLFAFGGSIANRAAPLTTTLGQPLGVTVTAPGTSITVTDSADSQAETEIKPKSGTPSTTVVQQPTAAELNQAKEGDFYASSATIVQEPTARELHKAEQGDFYAPMKGN